MALLKRRLIIWLVKAYIRKWGRIMLLSFLLGLVFFFILKQFLFTAISTITTENKQVIGIIGSDTINSLPPIILSQISEGLTRVDQSGVIQPGLASSWKILDDGKTYAFTLKKSVVFTDGTPLTAKEIHLSYSDVTTSSPNPSTIIFHLKENYAPFLLTVSKPIFRKDFVGVGPYTISSIKLNGSFVETLTIKEKNNGSTKIYQFYPTEDALKIAFALGEVSSAVGLSDTTFLSSSFEKFPNTILTKSTNYSSLVTLFYNTQDKNLSDRKIRDALSYSIANTFPQGERAFSSIPPLSWAYSPLNQHTQDPTHAAALLDSAGGASNLPMFTIDTLSKYAPVAKMIQQAFASVGVKIKIVVVDDIPQSFQMFIGDFTVSEDPDQYTLWHSYQSNNITNFNSDKRIDKLLEDGRQTIDQDQRVKIYADFQKYLTDEQPATFLYFPYSYTIKRK